MERTINRTAGRIDWSSAVWAGLIAGAVFIMLEMILVPAFGMGSPWGPPRMIAAIILGKGVLPMMGQPVTFRVGVFVVALLIHFALSIVYGLVLGAIANRLTTGQATAVGGIYGLLLYLVNFYLFTAIFPWFAMARNGVSIFSHVVFGAIAGLAYKGLQHRAERGVTAKPAVPRPA